MVSPKSRTIPNRQPLSYFLIPRPKLSHRVVHAARGLSTSWPLFHVVGRINTVLLRYVCLEPRFHRCQRRTRHIFAISHETRQTQRRTRQVLRRHFRTDGRR